MFLFRFISVLAIVVAVCANISIDEIDFKIYGDDDRTFEDQVSRAMEETVSMSDTAASILEIVPGPGDAGSEMLSNILATMADSSWENRFIKAIADETHRAIAQNRIEDMKADMKTITSNFNNLKTYAKQ